MKLTVIQPFRDIVTKKMYAVGDVIETFAPEREKDVLARGLVEGEKSDDEGDKKPATDIDMSGTWQGVTAAVKTFADVEKLKGYLATEKVAAKPRESVVKAIEGRIVELGGEGF